MNASRASFKSFAESTREDWAIINTQLADTQRMAVDHIIEQLRYLERDHGGFPVSRLEHSLQTATRAERDGRDEEYLVCALLHDIGDTLAPYNHPQIVQRTSSPSCPMPPLDGPSSRHLPGLLLLASHRHGPNTRDGYRDSPYYDYTAGFCAKYDQVAFDSDYRNAPLDHYEPLVRRFFTPATAVASS